MSNERVVKSVRRYKAGYEVRTEMVPSHFEDMPDDHCMEMKNAYIQTGS